MTIRSKILALGFIMVLLSIVLLGGILSWTIVSQAKSDIIKFEETAIKNRRLELKEKSDLAYSAIKTLYSDAVKMRSRGTKISESQIKKNMASIINKLRFGEDKNEYFWIHSFNRNDLTDITMIMHPVMSSLQGSNLSELRYTSGKLKGKIVYATEIDEKIPFVQYMNEIAGREGGGFVSYDWPRPIQSGLTEYQPKISYVQLFNETNWILGTGVYISDIKKEKIKKQNELNTQIKTVVVTIIIVSIVVLVITFFGSFLLSLYIVQPINNSVQFLKEIAEGKGDLTKRLELKSNDETSELAEWFNLFVSQVQDIVKRIAEGGNTIENGTVRLITTINEVAQTAYTLTDLVSKRSEAIRRTSASIRDIRADIETSVDYSKNANKISKEAIDETSRGSEAVKTMADRMEGIMKAGKEVNNFLSIITEIAHQTNVLSINARIEASKAGEQGKGFAVVSERIRLLAERTTVAAEQIQNTIEQSNQRIVEGQEAVKTVDEHFIYINEKMEENSKIVDLIHKSNSGQNMSLTDLEHVLKNLEESGIEIAGVADQINTNTDTQLGISAEVSSQAEDLLNRIRQFRY